MARKRAGIAEGLRSRVNMRGLKSGRNSAYLSASFAHVGLLASMHARVDGERGSLNKLLTTTRMLADMRPHAAMNSF